MPVCPRCIFVAVVPGLYAVFERETEGEQARKHLQDEGWRTYLVRTIEKGWESICQG